MNNNQLTNQSDMFKTTDEVVSLCFSSHIDGASYEDFKHYSAESKASYPVVKMTAVGGDLHKMVHGLSTQDNTLHVHNSIGVLQVVNRSVVVRILGQVSKPKFTGVNSTRTFQVYAVVIERINEDGTRAIAFNAVLPKVSNSDIMRNIRKATKSNGVDFSSWGERIDAVSKQIFKACLDPRVFDIYAPHNYDLQGMSSGEVSQLHYRLGYQLFDSELVSPRDMSAFVKEAVCRTLDEATCKEIEAFNPYNHGPYGDDKPNYRIESWEGDSILFSSGTRVTLSKESIAKYINSGYAVGHQVRTEYGAIYKVSNASLLKCGCHRVDLDEIKTHVGIPLPLKGGEFTGVNSDGVDGVKAETLLEILHRNEIACRAEIGKYEDVIASDVLYAVQEKHRANIVNEINARLDILFKGLGLVKTAPFERYSRTGFNQWFVDQKDANHDRLVKIYSRTHKKAYANYLSEMDEVNAKITEANNQKRKVSCRFEWLNSVRFNFHNQAV